MKKWNKNVEHDDILAADYSYCILLIECIRELTSNNFNHNVTAILGDGDVQCYIQKRDDRIQKFEQELDRHTRLETVDNVQSQKGRKNYKCINTDVFQKVRKYRQEQAKLRLEKELDKLDSMKHFGKGAPNEDELLDALFCWIIHFEENEKLAKRVGNWWKKRKKKLLFNNSDIDAAKTKLYDEYETLQIVEDVIIRKDAKSLKGKMKIVRVTSIEKGNRFYQTLCVARHVASDNHYMFEVIRDFGTFRLRDLNVTNCEDALFRVRRVLQTNECRYKDANTFEPCRLKCKKYDPQYPGLVCKNCGHMHKQIKLYKDLKHLPVLLILQRRGRLGDTFPVSFNCMDLRICYTDRVSIN